MNGQEKVKTLQSIEDAPVIEGGEVSEVADDLPFHEEKHHADTSRALAFCLAVALPVSVMGHYLAVGLLEIYGHHGAVESLEKAYNAWLPVLAGLLGSVVAFYFTRDKPKKNKRRKRR